MINPDQQEKHLAPVDIKVKQGLTISTIVYAAAIIAGIMVIAELLERLIDYLRSS